MRNETANLKDHKADEKRCLECLAAVANSAADQLAIMRVLGMEYAPEVNLSANTSLTVYFERVVGALNGSTPTGRSPLPKSPRFFARGPSPGCSSR